MPRVTEYGPTRPHLSTGALGYTPGVPTGETPDPVDHADDGVWFIPVATSAAIAFVQAKEAQNAVSASTIVATFDTAPTAGNLLIAVITRREGYVAPALAGWTPYPAVDALAVADGGGGDNGSVVMFYRTAGISESSSVTVTKNGSFAAYLVIAEFEGGAAFDAVVSTASTTSTTSLTTTALTPAAAAVVIVGAIIQSNESTLTIGGGFTQLQQGRTGTANDFGPTTIAGYRIQDPAAGSYTMTATSNVSDSYAGMLLSFAAAAGSVNYIAALAVNDGDDATFDYVDVTQLVFLRGTLEPAVVLASSTLWVGLETAGAQTIAIYGANDSDYSDATLLDSVAFTAYGSYAIQRLDFDWSTTVGYSYLEFRVTTAMGVRVYEVSLYGPGATTPIGLPVIDDATWTGDGIRFSGTTSSPYVRNGLRLYHDDIPVDPAHTVQTNPATGQYRLTYVPTVDSIIRHEFYRA